MAQRLVETRLRELRGLLRDLLEEAESAADPMRSHWELPVLPLPDPGGRLSSTDLLSWWFRAPKDGANPWDTYLSIHDEPAAAPGAARVHDDASAEPDRELASVSWPALLEPEEQMAEAHAQGAVDCLYEFLHAFGRRDVKAAMSHVAEDYHAMEDDEEIDRLKMRHRLESAVDAAQGWEFAVSLVEAPEPVNHPLGVLIAGDIQVDANNPETGETHCRVERRVAVLQQSADGEWKITALALVKR